MLRRLRKKLELIEIWGWCPRPTKENLKGSVPSLDTPSRTSDFVIANLVICTTETTHNWSEILPKTFQGDKSTVRYQKQVEIRLPQ